MRSCPERGYDGCISVPIKSKSQWPKLGISNADAKLSSDAVIEKEVEGGSVKLLDKLPQ